MWNKLPTEWRICFEEAWYAFCSGKVPIGAVITDNNHKIIVSGRNGECTTILPRFSHAEINAILKMSSKMKGDYYLFSSVEPCVMCFSTLYVTKVKEIHFACRDSHAGGSYLNNSSDYFSIRDLGVFQYDNYQYCYINAVLNLMYELRTRDEETLKLYISKWEQNYPGILMICQNNRHNQLFLEPKAFQSVEEVYKKLFAICFNE